MSRIIPNERTWIGFLPDKINGVAQEIADISAPTETEVKRAIDLTCLCVSLNASFQGNTVPTPQLCSLFETSVPGTSQATFQADFYRDDAATPPFANAGNAVTGDVAYENLPLGQKGWFIVSRFKAGWAKGDETMPEAGDKVEVWPVYVTSRTDGALASNTALTFSLTCSVPDIPNAEAIVAAGRATVNAGGTAPAETVDSVETASVDDVVDIDAAEADGGIDLITE